jgi:hypothetical protein
VSDSAERALWRAHLGLHGAVTAIEVSERELSDVARSVERAFAGLYDAWDGRVDASAGLGRATEEAQRAHALVHAGAELGELSRHLAAACDALASVRAALPSTREPAPPRVASPVRPALHHTARPSLVPTLRVRVAPPIITERYAPLKPPTSHDDLAQHGAKAAAHIAAHLERVLAKRERVRQVLTAPSEAEAFVSRWARECFDEVAMLASQRQPPW